MPVPLTMLSWLLLTSTPEPAEARPDAGAISTGSRASVTAGAPRAPREIRISPGRGLLLILDAPVARDRIVLEARESFRHVTLSADGLLLTLLPSRELRMGRRLTLTIHFVDEAEPNPLDLVLVVSPQSEPQWEVSRRPSPFDRARQEAEESRAQLQECQTALLMATEEHSGREWLMRMLIQGQLSPEGISSKFITAHLIIGPTETFHVHGAVSYRAANGNTNRPMQRLAVDLLLTNQGSTPWAPTQAQLITPTGEWTAEVWSPRPIPPEGTERVLIEADIPGNAAPGPSTLKLWNQQATRMATISGVRFP
ncbi:DUF2381 family protein [Melittangium boletus]|uniref:DUF2381 family protein n=1 Tax=Melittangium boletus TaxID=83453 RepID=UPI003DA2B2F9